MSETRESIGRIEVAPEVVALIAHEATLGVDGVAKMARVPRDGIKLLRRGIHQDGTVLQIEEDAFSFDLYIIVAPDTDMTAVSNNVKSAVISAVDNMIGMPINTVNVHIEDVLYNTPSDTA